MKKLLIGSLVVAVCLSAASAGPSRAASTKKKTTTTKAKAKRPTATKPKATTPPPKVRTLNMCDLMSGIDFVDVFPGKTLSFLRFIGQPKATGADDWKTADLDFQSKLARTSCELYVSLDGVQDDYVGIGQRKLAGAALRADLAARREVAEVRVPGIEGVVLQSKGKMRTASGELLSDDEDLSGRACVVVYESPKGTFDVVHQLYRTKTTADGMSCEIAYETLRRTLARVASGKVAALPV